jgi:DNA-binding transcriptional LysR family regulator
MRELRYFVAVAETLHFGRAAERLQIAQPALSRSIKGLEAKLGVTLFERSSREVSLTPAGAALVVEAEAVLQAGTMLIEHAHELGSSGFGELDIGFMPAVEESASSLIEALHAEHPGVVVNHRREYQRQLVEAVRSRQIAAAIVMADPELEDEFEVMPFVSSPVVALVGPGHPLAGRETASLAELGRYPLSDFVSYPGLLPRVLAASLEETGLDPRWVLVETPPGRGPGRAVADDEETVWLQTVELRQPDSPMRRLEISPPGLSCPFAIISRSDNQGALLKLLRRTATEYAAADAPRP